MDFTRHQNLAFFFLLLLNFPLLCPAEYNPISGDMMKEKMVKLNDYTDPGSNPLHDPPTIPSPPSTPPPRLRRKMI
ncbi:hypothetical protein ZOSMA_114G00770 [Zostera marina]|uniref:Transmembrane protein n=1 Tax=Zostera marina TaxID=29655 RepID=A0A0K9Q4U1_ZOSMR|nr:hypothetical protein ZOSMA_114G00770 [Zostera marina]